MTCIRRPHAMWTTCNCPRCLAGMRRIRKLAHLGRLPQSRGDEAVARLLEWHDARFSSGWVASAAGVPQAWVITITSGKVTKPGPVLSAKVLRADIMAATRGFGPALGARRRLRALATMGWNVSDLAGRTGIPTATLSRIRKGEALDIGAARHHIIDAAYQELRGQVGPSTQAASRARNLGWFGPDLWDDIDDRREDPLAVGSDDDVDEVAVQRAVAGDRIATTRAERIEATRRLAASGMSDAEVAARLGVADRSVSRWRSEFGIESRWSA